MRIAGLKTIRSSARWLRSQFGDSALILGYHRVAEVKDDLFGLCVSPENFAEQLKILCRHANLVRLDNLVEDHENENFPNRAVAITFDDGYVDLLYTVKPLLDLYAVPATVFIATGYLGRAYWWNQLENILLSQANTSQGIRLIPDNSILGWRLENSGAVQTKNGSSRISKQFLWQLHERLLLLPFEQRDAAISQLEASIDLKTENSHEVRGLTVEEIKEIKNDELIDIGAHTITHPRLTYLSLEDQISEIQGSKSSLEKILGRPVSGFSYPHGSYSSTTKRILKDSGFTYACTSESDVVLQGSDIFSLPRFWIGDWDSVTFERWLRKWS